MFLKEQRTLLLLLLLLFLCTIPNSSRGLHDALRWDRKAVPKRRYGNTILRCVESQNSADLICISAEAWNYA